MPTSVQAEVLYSDRIHPASLAVVFPSAEFHAKYEACVQGLPSHTPVYYDEETFAYSRVLCPNLTVRANIRQYDDNKRMVFDPDPDADIP